MWFWGWVLCGVVAPAALYVRTPAAVPWVLGFGLYVATTVTAVSLYHGWVQSLHGHQVQALLGLIVAGVVVAAHLRGLLGYLRWCRGVVVIHSSRW